MAKTGGYEGPLEQVAPCQWRIPRTYRADMRVDGLIFADDVLIGQIKKDQGPEQVVNVATLPGIQKASLAMPDIHWGYGFCIGGVAATDPERVAIYLTSRGLTNESYYVAGKAARAMGVASVDSAARVCHAPSTLGLKATRIAGA